MGEVTKVVWVWFFLNKELKLTPSNESTTLIRLKYYLNPMCYSGITVSDYRRAKKS